VLLGSDFPSIPYEYAHQLEALERLDLGPEWLRAVCWDNAVRLLGLGIRGAPEALSPVPCKGSTTQEGLIGFDFGRSIQEKRVEDPGLSRKRSLETISADSKRTDFALAA